MQYNKYIYIYRRNIDSLKMFVLCIVQRIKSQVNICREKIKN